MIDGGESGSDMVAFNLHGLKPYETIYEVLNGEHGTDYRLNANLQHITERLCFTDIEQIPDIAIEVPPALASTHLSVVEHAAPALDLSSLTVWNSDCCEDLTVVVSSTAGTIAADSHDGVKVTDSGTAAVPLTGAAEHINSYLKSLAKIHFTGL